MNVGLKESIRDHYDRLSPIYRRLWGEHLHHGYWIDGNETKELAQVQLIDLLADAAGLSPANHVLDIGCGVGGSALYLAERFGVRVCGITISPVQAAIASERARQRGAACNFVVMDAEEIALRARFNVVWSIEALSHMPARLDVIRNAVELLEPGGTFAIIDWFKSTNLLRDADLKYWTALEASMLTPRLSTVRDYTHSLETNGCRIIAEQDLTMKVSKTWDISAEFLRQPELWRFARKQGPGVVRFLRGIRLMKKAIRNGVFRVGMIAAKKAL